MDDVFDEEEEGLEEPLAIGDNPRFRIWGFLVGAALMAVTAGITIFWGFNKLSFWIGLFGVIFLGKSFRVRGVAIKFDGLEIWSYWAWFIGGRRLIPQSEMRVFSLGQLKGKYSVTVRLQNGEEYRFPEAWNAVNDARNIILIATNMYDVESELDVTDRRMLDELNTFEDAPRLSYTLGKSAAESGYKAAFVFALQDDEEEIDSTTPSHLLEAARIMDGLRIQLRTPILFGRRRAYYEDADGNAWHLVKGLARSRVYVRNGDTPLGSVVVKRSFLGSGSRAIWQWPEGSEWWAKFEGEQDWDPVTIRFYRGNPKVGHPVTAVFDGDDESGSLDIAEPSVCPWVAVGLGSLFLVHGTGVTFSN